LFRTMFNSETQVEQPDKVGDVTTPAPTAAPRQP
jgi:hypothetical protein